MRAASRHTKATYRDAGRAECLGPSGCIVRAPDQLPRQRRRRYRHGAHRYERAQKLFTAGRLASQNHPLHAGQRRSAAPNQGPRRRSRSLHYLCVLQHRQVSFLRRRAHEAEHGLPLVSSTPEFEPRPGSDFSPGPFAPLMGIQGMVTRTGWNGETWGANQRISVDEARAGQHHQRCLQLP